MSLNLADIRPEIDEIDTLLVELLRKRFELCSEVARIKHRENLPILHPTREEEIVQRVKEQGAPFGKEIAEVFRGIMQTSVQMQVQLTEELSSK